MSNELLMVERALEQAKEQYKKFYSSNRKHLAYAQVKQGLAALQDKIAKLEHQVQVMSRG